MTPERASKSINSFLGEFLDTYALVGIMPDGRQIIIRRDDYDGLCREQIQKMLLRAVESFKTK